MQVNHNVTIGFPYLISGSNGEGVYPGSTTRRETRPLEHEAALRHNRHWNDNLQRAVDQHGWEAFVYLWFKPVSIEKLGEAEQALYDNAVKAGLPVFNKIRPLSKAHPCGYKLSDATKAKQSLAKEGNQYGAKNYAFIAPDGEIHRTTGLEQFCKEHGLDVSCMSRVAARERPVHKGWRRWEDK